jgi:ABC-type Mn2+/Zn2+ transport system permease subunit
VSPDRTVARSSARSGVVAGRPGIGFAVVEFLTDPVSWWIEPFVENEFMRRALYAGLLTVLSTSVVGTWVVLRGMSFVGDALAHGVLPGIAVAFVIGASTTMGAFVAALVMVLGINLVRSRSPLPDDTAIGILFVGMLALAVVVLSSQSGSYVGDLNRFLFGSVTGVDDSDLARQAVAAVLIILGVVLFYRAFLVMAFDEAQAELFGLRPRLAHAMLLVLVAVAVVASFETVGNLMVFAFLVAPPATASLVVRRVPLIMTSAVGIGAVSVVVGSLVSFHYDTAAGATMALCAVAIFMVVMTARSFSPSR